MNYEAHIRQDLRQIAELIPEIVKNAHLLQEDLKIVTRASRYDGQRGAPGHADPTVETAGDRQRRGDEKALRDAQRRVEEARDQTRDALKTIRAAWFILERRKQGGLVRDDSAEPLSRVEARSRGDIETLNKRSA